MASRSILDENLAARLADVLPKDLACSAYHISTPPTRTNALSPPPPGARTIRTYLESHFLAVTIQAESKNVLIFAIEIFIYSTASTTTYFVSKADSTGYLGLLSLARGISPIRDISGAFLQWLIAEHQRPGVPGVVSLFARAQDQYLFPGSVEFKGKHVLDDRGLVRWWCRVLDPLVQAREDTQGYLIVPGQDKYESQGFLPPARKAWRIGHPLVELHGENLPPRCVIPHFPDDPKARYLDELEDEGKGAGRGSWSSISTLEQFWEMMAFRQECSAGRMVGFIWVVLKATKAVESAPDSQRSISTVDAKTSSVLDTAIASSSQSESAQSSSQPQLEPGSHSQSLSQRCISPNKARQKTKKLSGIIHPRTPKIKTEQRQPKIDIPLETAHYSWPPSGRGEIVMPEKDYKRVTELLLRLDFANLDIAIGSTQRWIAEVSRSWGMNVVGTRVVEVRKREAQGVAVLDMGLVRKRRKVVEV